MNGIPPIISSPAQPLSWRTEIPGILGVTAIVLLLFWPTLNGSRTIVSDTWHLNYPWARELSDEELARAEARGEAATIKEPYILDTDLYFQVYPWYSVAKRELANGRWPHWNPHAYCGSALYANHLVPVHHPPLLLALLFAPLQQVHTVSAFLAYWIGGIGLYLYLRTRRLRLSACLAAVGLYLSCGHYMPLWTYQLPAIMYYPWILWASDALEARPSIVRALPLSLLVGLQLASGHPAYVVPFLYLVFLHRVLIWVFARKPVSWWLRRLAILAMAFLAAGLISAFQNLPTFEHLSLSSREAIQEARTHKPPKTLQTPSISNESETEKKIPDLVETEPSRLAVLFAPVFQRRNGQQHPYIGIPLLLLAILGMLKLRPSSERAALIALLVLCTLICVPQIFRSVTRFIPGMSFSPYIPFDQPQFLLVLFAGVGFHSLLDGETRSDRPLKWAFTLLSVIGALGFAALFVPDSFLNPDTRWELEHSTLACIVLILGVIAIILPAAAWWRSERQGWLPGYYLPLILIIAVVYGHFYRHPVCQPVPFMPETASIAALPRSPEYRIIQHTSGPPAHAGTLETPLSFGANLPTWAGCFDTQGSDSFILSNQTAVLKALDPRSVAWNRLSLPLTDPDALSSPLLDAMAVGHVISDDPDLLERPDSGAPSSEWALVHSGGLYIYQRLYALPRWYLADEAIPASGLDEALALIQATGLRSAASDAGEIKRVVIEVEDWPGVPTSEVFGISPDRHAEDGDVTLLRDDTLELEFAVTSPVERFLVLSDTYHPEWHAFLDGEEVEILKANGAYRAVLVPEGEHRIVFRYVPRAFQLGLIISVCSLLVLAFGALIEVKKAKWTA